MNSIEEMDLASIIALFENSSLGEMELSTSRYSFACKRQGQGTYVSSEPAVAMKQTKQEENKLVGCRPEAA